MRTVSEWPQNAGKYPWDTITAAIEDGEIVELCAEDYGVATVSIGSAVRSHRERFGLSWDVAVRKGSVYIRKAQP